MKYKSTVLALIAFPFALALCGAILAALFTGPNAMFGRLGSAFLMAIFGGEVGAGLMLVGFVCLWIKYTFLKTRPRNKTSELRCWSGGLTILCAIFLGFASKGFPEVTIGIVAGGIGGAIVGWIVAAAEKQTIEIENEPTREEY